MTARTLALIAAIVLTAAPESSAQSRSNDVVKASAQAEKVGADGKQVVTITLDVDPKYYIYANPVGNADLEAVQTTLTFTGKAKPESVKIDYPKGELVKDQAVGDYKVLKGKVTIKATLRRGKEGGPLEASVKLQACSKASCLLPATIKLNVP